MHSLILDNIPDDLYSRLRQAAASHNRPLDAEALHCLRTSLETNKDSEQPLAKARALRQLTAKHPISAEDLNELIEQGRR